MPTHLGHRVLPCLLVTNMRRSLEFYLETLGFTQTGYYPIESEPIRTEVRRDDIAIILYTEPVHARDQPPSFTGALYIFPAAIDPRRRRAARQDSFRVGTGKYGYWHPRVCNS
jgi:catechol 2,3-dioxygenase-like lactoylglutathione lyase family enzyme